MKLLLIAVVWMTGLFVVIAAVTMVAVETGPIAATSGSAAVQKGVATSARMAGDASAETDLRTGDHDRASHFGAGYGQTGHGQAGRIRTGQSQASDHRTRQGGAHAGPATALPSAPAWIHAVYAHTGSANTSPFTIGGNGTWKLAWSYKCAGFDPDPSFTVSQDGTDSVDGAYIARLGAAGRGVTWAYKDAGTHYLAIRTQCRWRITVTRQS